eukprot:s6241_g5.t1
MHSVCRWCMTTVTCLSLGVSIGGIWFWTHVTSFRLVGPSTEPWLSLLRRTKMERSHAAAINAATFVNMAGMYSYTTESCPQRFVLRRRLCAAPARCRKRTPS